MGWMDHAAQPDGHAPIVGARTVRGEREAIGGR
jgi:hypothetical protein